MKVIPENLPQAPEPLPSPVFDSHTHLDIVAAERELSVGRSAAPADRRVRTSAAERGTAEAAWSPSAQIEAAAKVGVDRLVQVGVDVGSSRWGVALAQRENAVVATVALHPNEAPRVTDLDAAFADIVALAGDPRVRGIGETGLDFFRTKGEGLKAQEESFRNHIALAKQVGKPLIVHDRDAHADILRVLDEEGAPDRVVMHCFSGDADFARACVKRGFHLSFAGTVTFKNAPHLREAAALTPADQILVETDAPYLTPMPFRGKPNASYLIPLTVRALAEARAVPLSEMCRAISANGERLFGPW